METAVIRAVGEAGDLVWVVMTHGEVYAARQAGYRRIASWTERPLRAARKIHLDAGFSLVGEERHRHFGVGLIGQRYELELTETTASLPHPRRCP